MSSRLDKIREANRVVSVIWNLEYLRRSEEGVSISHFAVGVLAGFCQQRFHTKYIGGFRENPVRTLVFVICWFVVVSRGIRSLDTESIRSLSVGHSLGSFLHRLV